MKEKLERLARLWPKDSEWTAKMECGSIWLNRWDGKQFSDSWVGANKDDRRNAPGLEVVEGEMLRLHARREKLGVAYIQTIRLVGKHIVEVRRTQIDGPDFSACGKSRSEALVDAAIAVMEHGTFSADRVGGLPALESKSIKDPKCSGGGQGEKE